MMFDDSLKEVVKSQKKMDSPYGPYPIKKKTSWRYIPIQCNVTFDLEK